MLDFNINNKLDDNYWECLLDSIVYDEDGNNYKGKNLLNMLIINRREDLIYKHIVKLVNADEDFSLECFVNLVKDVNYYNKDLVLYIKTLDLDKYPVFVSYINDIISNNSLIELSKIIVSDSYLINYISVDNILLSYGWEFDSFEKMNPDEEVFSAYGYNNFMEMYNDFKDASYEDLRELFLNDKEEDIMRNFIKRLNSKDLVRIIRFNYFIGINDNIERILEEFLEKYFSYERAIFFIDVLNLSASDKVYIVNKVYGILTDDICKVKEEIIERNFKKILDFAIVDSEFRDLIPELINSSYNEDFFKRAFICSVNINEIEYMQVFLAQLIRFVAFKRGISLERIEMEKFDGSEIASWTELYNRIKVFYNYLGSEMDDDFMKLYIEICFHELRHAYQDNFFAEKISLEELMYDIENLLFFLEDNYYDENYDKVFGEKDAYNYAVYDTVKYFNYLDKYGNDDYGFKDIYISEIICDKSFIEDRKLIRDPRYFCLLWKRLFSIKDYEAIINYKEKFKALELIVDDKGHPYSVLEIEDIINSIKIYNTNDMEYNKLDRDRWLFYKRYLYCLKWGIANGVISGNYGRKKIRK